MTKVKSKKVKKPAAARQSVAKPPAGWYDRRFFCQLLAISPQQFHRKYQDLVPAADQKMIDRTKYFRGRALLNAWLDDELKNASAAAAMSGEDPLLAGGGGSPALERYRHARAGLAEIELQEREQKVVDVRVLLPMLSGYINAVKGFGDYLNRNNHRQLLDLFNDAMQTALEATERLGEQLTKQQEAADAG
jgi:hypothetical protein